MIYLLSFLIIIVGLLAYLLYITNRKYQRAVLYCEAYVNFIAAVYSNFKHASDHLDQVDRLGAFKADDEVGFIFTEIKNTVDDLHNFLLKYVNTTTKEEKA